jgi:hypothetical protein
MIAHAKARSQQRAIPHFIAMLLLDYGASMRHHGADVVYIDKPARKRLRLELGERGLALVEPWFGIAAVVADDGQLLTVFHRKQRLKRPGGLRNIAITQR